MQLTQGDEGYNFPYSYENGSRAIIGIKYYRIGRSFDNLQGVYKDDPKYAKEYQAETQFFCYEDKVSFSWSIQFLSQFIIHITFYT